MTAQVLLNRFLLIFILQCLPLLSEEDTLYTLFSPPTSWEVLHPKQLDPSVKIGFSGKAKRTFVPSINLVEEKVKVSTQEYLQTVKKLHESNRYTRWRNLGSFQTKAGTAFLTELDTQADGQEIRILQLILHQGQTIHLLTAACLKDEFPIYQRDFLNAFRSLQLVKDLSIIIEDSEKKSLLEKKTKALLASLTNVSFEKTEWNSFEKWILQEFKEEGAYWQILLLTTLQKKILSKS